MDMCSLYNMYEMRIIGLFVAYWILMRWTEILQAQAQVIKINSYLFCIMLT